MTTKAKAGEVLKLFMRGGSVVTDETVLPPCDLKDRGHWYCATHRVHLDNFNKGEHLDHGKHHIAWLCYAHGLEQP